MLTPRMLKLMNESRSAGHELMDQRWECVLRRQREAMSKENSVLQWKKARIMQTLSIEWVIV